MPGNETAPGQPTSSAELPLGSGVGHGLPAALARHRPRAHRMPMAERQASG